MKTKLFRTLAMIALVLSVSMNKLSAQVTVYEHNNFGGKSHTYTEGLHSLFTTVGNDVLSSIKVSPGWKVTLYEHDPSRGKTLVLTSDVKELAKENFNDITSNIKVERVASSNSLLAGETLAAGKHLTSANGKFVLKLQEDDGHLCVYHLENGTQGAFVWGSEAYGFERAKLVMQTDGNLVVSEGNTPKWASNTHPYVNAKFKDVANKPVKLVLENDGSLKLYTATGSVVWTNR